jgi:hypothetical protein
MKETVWYSTIVLCLLFLIFLSCENEKSTNPDNEVPYIYGSVILDGSQTHDSVLVRIIQTCDSTHSSTDGTYEFTSLSPGTYTVTASYPEYSPAFETIHFTGTRSCHVPDLILHALHCYPRDSLPEGYPLGVNFKEDISFTWSPDFYVTGDSIFVVGFEYFMPPFVNYMDESNNHDFDLILTSSMGDREKTPIYRNLGSVPEVWRYAYLIESAESTSPQSYNGVIEIEPTGGWIIAMYHSYWLKRYICKSIEVIPGD